MEVQFFVSPGQRPGPTITHTLIILALLNIGVVDVVNARLFFAQGAAQLLLLIPIVLALRPGGATSPQPRATPWV